MKDKSAKKMSPQDKFKMMIEAKKKKSKAGKKSKAAKMSYSGKKKATKKMSITAKKAKVVKHKKK